MTANLPEPIPPDPPNNTAAGGPQLRNYTDAALLAAHLTGLHYLTCKAQLLLESGGAWPPPGNNPSNIMWPDDTYPDWDWFKHVQGRQPNTALIYDSIQHGVEAYAVLLNQGDAYAGVRASRSQNWAEQCKAIGQSPWDAGHYRGNGSAPGSALLSLAQDLLMKGDTPNGPKGTPTPNPPAKPPTPHAAQRAPEPPNPTGIVQLTPWKFWCQTNDPAVDGDPGSGPNAGNNCGPESVAMCLWHLTGVALDADYIQDGMRPPGYQGYLTVADIASWLARFAGIQADILTIPPQDLIATERSLLALGHPLIGLFAFSSPDAPDRHFRPIIRVGPTGVHTADPATGRRRIESHQDHLAWYKGYLVHIKRRRCILP